EKAVVECAAHLQRLCKALDILELGPALGSSQQQKQICTLKTTATEWEIRKALLQAQGLVLRANHLKDVSLDELQTFVNLQRSKLKQERVLVESLEEKYAEHTVSKHMGSALLTQLCCRVQLWPAMEYLALLWQYKLTADCVSRAYLQRKDCSQQLIVYSEIKQLIAFCLKFTPATSQQLQGLFYLLDLHTVSSDEISLLWSELVNAALASFWNTTISTDPEYWLAWKPVSVEEKKKPKSLMDCSLKVVCSKWSQWDVTGLPILLASNVTLGEWMERAQQLQEVRAVLWNNLAFSSMAEFRFTDSRLQLAILDKQLVALKNLVPVQLQDEYLKSCDKLSSKDPVALQSIFKVLKEIAAQDVLPEEVLCLWMTCLQQFFGQEGGPQNVPEAVQRGSLWVNLGLLQIHIWLPQTRFDPAVKREYKLKYAVEELHRLECEWKTHNLSTQLLTGKDLEDETINRHSHPHIRMLRQRIQKLKNQIASLGQKQAFRPQSPSYDCLYQELHQYASSIAQISKVQDLLARLLQFLHGDKSHSVQVVQKVLSEEAAWQQSHHQFRKHLTEDYAAFPDVVTPLQAAVLQMQHGLRLVASEVHRTTLNGFVCPNKLGTLVASLLSFPSVGGPFPTYLSHADALCSVNSLDVLHSLRRLSQKYSVEDSDREQRMCLTQEQLLVNALLYLRCHVLSKGELDHKSLQLFRHLCQVIINEWDEQERLAQEEEEQKNVLYRYKAKSHGTGLSEEEEEEREFRNKFPLHEKDFKDITNQASLEEEMETEDGLENEAACETLLLSHHSLKTVMEVHQQICLYFARSLWYQQNLPANQTKYHLTTFISCYQTGASLVAHFYPLIGSEMNDDLQGCQLLASTILQNTLFEGETSELGLQLKEPYDFYQHPNIQQVQLCQPVLENFAKEVKALLQEWPDHPALVQLLVVMDRIRSFPLSSPLSKFLNGLEILLAKSQDWEESASRAVSLRKHLDLVTQLIIQWHKLELNCWSTSLDSTMQRQTEKSMKHWLSVYQIIEKYWQEQTEKKTEEMNLTAVVGTLQAFIEGSTLGEFHTRLQMLLEFHCHVLLMPQVEGNDTLRNVLWNLYHYYKQFSECVQTKLTELRQPIEKELKEFVKISKWNDVSFWAVKQSVEKAHRTLFKFMKKFEAALNEPCRSALMETSRDEQQLSLQKQGSSDNQETKIQSLHNILRKKLATTVDAVQAAHSEGTQGDAFHPESLQARLPKLTKRMAKICTNFVKNSTFVDLVENLDQFTGDIIASAHELQNASVSLLADKEKQKSEVKHLLVQKQRALAELFKNLATTGLSYRKGLAWSHSKTSQDLLFLHPLDLRSALALVNCTHKMDTMLLSEISSSWDGCQKYFYQSLARHCRLQTALLAPSKEIGLGTIERCKGFTAHLMKMLVKQRSALTGLTEQWIILRNLLSCVQEIDAKLTTSNEYDVAFPPQDGVQQWTDRLQFLTMQVVMVLEQLSWLIECCPKGQFVNAPRTDMEPANLKHEKSELNPTDPSDLQYLTPVPSDQLPSGCKMQKQDPLCQQLASRVKDMLVEVKAIKADVDRIRQLSCETLFHSWRSFEVCSLGIESLFQVSTQLQDIESLFVLPEMEGCQTALIRSLVYIQGEINRSVDDFAIWKAQLFSSISHCDGDQDSDDGFVEHFSEQVELAIHAILSAIQCLVERRKEKGEKETSLEDGVPSADRLKSGLLTKLLDEDICSDVSSLQAQKIISAISELLEQLKSYGEDYTAYKCKLFNQSCHLLVRLMPVLYKYSNIILFYLTVSLATHRSTGKLLSVLANIFTELAQKGFCLPKELLEEEAGEGATEFHDYEDGGIGEGEGKKDVSDKIENEDQNTEVIITTIATPTLDRHRLVMVITLSKGAVRPSVTELRDHVAGIPSLTFPCIPPYQDRRAHDSLVEDTSQKGQEKDNEDPESKPDIEGEDNAIEMSEDFEGKTYDGDEGKQEEDEKSDEDDELDKQMGNLGDAEADKLDERLWGDDEEEEDESCSEDSTTETGPGMDERDSELVAKDDNLDAGNKNDEKPTKNEEKEKETDDGEIKEKIHEQEDEREYDENESDPYHGKQEKQPEAEALDLPDDLNLENGEKDEEDKEEEGENPFEIEDKIMDVDEKQVKEEETEDVGEHGEDPEQMEDSSEDKAEGDDKMEEETNEKENAEHPNENTGEEDDDTTEDQKEEEEQKETGIPTSEHGIYPQEEDNNHDQDEQLPDAAERMEHETCGQAGEKNLQSDTSVELAGTAPEKDTVKEEHGSGAADANQSEGHESELMAQMASQKQSRKKTQSFKRKPGQADNERSTGDHSQHVHKRLRMMESSSEAEQNPNPLEQKAEEADAFEHIKQGTESYDAQTYDVANEEQQKLAMPLCEDDKEPVSEDAAMEADGQNAEDLSTVETEKLVPEVKMSGASKSGTKEKELEAEDLNSEGDEECGTEKPLSEVRPDRSKDSTIHTAHQFLMNTKIKHIVKNPEELRQELEKQLEIWQAGNADEEKAAAEMWQRYLLLTAALSQQLCEQLRLILEPTQAAKLKGDYRTGKRLNMRKVIPYIASQFRKDKIWLRRTKPSKRQYQICLALDDSASMIDNHSKQLAYESLAVIGNALTLLEVGQIAMCSFGETVQLLHPFHEQFNDQSGTRILRLCKFEQKKTKIAQFLESTTNMFAAAQQFSQNMNPENPFVLIVTAILDFSGGLGVGQPSHWGLAPPPDAGSVSTTDPAVGGAYLSGLAQFYRPCCRSRSGSTELSQAQRSKWQQKAVKLGPWLAAEDKILLSEPPRQRKNEPAAPGDPWMPQLTAGTPRDTAAVEEDESVALGEPQRPSLAPDCRKLSSRSQRLWENPSSCGLPQTPAGLPEKRSPRPNLGKRYSRDTYGIFQPRRLRHELQKNWPRGPQQNLSGHPRVLRGRGW
ncbi:UNVERIFIED_CONTAM: hypothetical protein K2H54_066664, partial [Gekko kuhli]